MDIWIFLSLVAVGPIRECRKLIEALKHSPDGSAASTDVFANFNIKTDINGHDKSQNATSLERICAEKVTH